MNRTKISNLLRKLGLLFVADGFRYRVEKSKHKKENQKFKNEHPDVLLPPDYLIYESHAMSYHSYFYNGEKDANYFASLFKKHVDLSDGAILDWGCGPGRIIRHLPKIITTNCSFYGTDYNENSINWCAKNLKGISFNKNGLDASLPYQDDFFSVVYGLSIVTHLSEKLHHDWFKELYRVLKPGGIMLLTTQGDIYRAKLSQKELQQFDQGELVVRGQVKEGHRTYSAFQPKTFMYELFSEMEIVAHIEMPIQDNWYPQDKWIVRKKA